jgi:phosphoglycolate phosphatase
MTLIRPTIVLFDMDGTTVRHINPKLLSFLEYLDDMIFRISSLFSKHDISTNTTANPVSQGGILVHRILHRFRQKEVDQIVQPCPGIFTLLNILKDHGIPIGIVSNGLGKGYGHDILEKFHLSDYFIAQIFREDIHKSKPHPDPLIRALKKMKDPVGEDDVIWYIGDRHKDITAALNANLILPANVIPISYGVRAAITILKKGIAPDHIVMNYAEFAARVQTLLATGTPDNQRPSEENTGA